jgi:hypothetical protein
MQNVFGLCDSRKGSAGATSRIMKVSKTKGEEDNP